MGALLEVPFALISFVIYRIARVLMRTLANLQMWRRPEIGKNWRIISRELVSRPMALPMVMTTGPRWNTHAVIGTVGPLEVTSSIALDRAVVARSCVSWSAVISRYPHHRIAASLGGGDQMPVTPSEVKLEPGTYRIILRCYLVRGAPAMPPVLVDGEEVVPKVDFPADVNAFYEGYGARTRPLYWLFHFYLTTLLWLRGWVPESLVFRELGPVANPETGFLFDPFHKGQRLRITVEPQLIETHLVMLTMYGRDSFPIHSARVQNREYESPPALRDGFYVVRIHPLVRGENPSSAVARVRISVV